MEIFTVSVVTKWSCILVDNRTKLMEAIQNETKILREQSEQQIEVQFILNNWKIFTENKSNIFAVLKGAGSISGTDVLALMGIRDTYIEKVPKAQLLTACYKFKGSALHKLFSKIIQKRGTGTVFFIVNKSGIVVTNQYNLSVDNEFTHVLKQDKQNDLYWAPVDTVKDSLVIYES